MLISIYRFREIQKHDPRVTESKSAILFHFIFWVLLNVIDIGFLVCQFTYTHTENLKWYQAGVWFHIAITIDSCFLQVYLAFIIYKLSQPIDLTKLIREIKAGHARNVHTKFEISDYKYIDSQGEELMEALKTQAELEIIY